MSKTYHERYVETAISHSDLEQQLKKVKVELKEAREVIKNQYETSNIDWLIDDEKKSNECDDEYLAYLILDRKDMLDQIAKLS